MPDKKQNLSKQILKSLGLGLVIYFIIFSSPYGVRRLLRGIKKDWKRQRAINALDRLQRRKLIAYRHKKGNILEVELTDAGRKKFLEYKADEIEIRKQKRWDGNWRIICSDIPESKKKARDALRGKFREWGFYPMQKSVFLCPYPCEDEIAVIRDVFGVPTASLFIVETRHIGNENYFKNYFRLR